MSKKNIIKILLDVVMTGILVLLYNSHVFALAFHEIAGLILSGLFLIHCLFNKKWITSVTTRLFKKGTSTRVKVGYIINVLLLVAFTFVIISGIKTSQVLFPSAVETKGSIWRGIHHFAAAFAMILVGIHIGLHWGFISGIWKKAIRIPAKISRPIGIAMLVAILAFGSYSIATSSFTSWLAEPFTSTQLSHGDEIRNPAPSEESATADDASITDEAEKSSDEVKDESGDYNDRRPKEGENKSGSHDDDTITAEDLAQHPEGEKKSEEGNPAVIASTMATYLSIMSVFAAIAYYIDKLAKKRKTENSAVSDGKGGNGQ